jgi:hypothetical protein
MKNIQTGILKILALTSAILCSSLAYANDVNYLLSNADSLYIKKQYTQSFELYQSLYKDGRYSPAMLLKMAYIQEGLGHISLSLYYLNLYYLASGDAQVLNKLQELASKNKLEGYEYSEMNQIMFTLQKYRVYISGMLAAIVIFLLTIIYRQRKKETRPISIGILTTIMIAILALQVNMSYESRSGIIADSNTYLMSGPSAGANVVALIGEGHKIRIKDKKDVWLKVEWLDKEAYIKENQVIKVQL